MLEILHMTFWDESPRLKKKLFQGHTCFFLLRHWFEVQSPNKRDKNMVKIRKLTQENRYLTIQELASKVGLASKVVEFHKKVSVRMRTGGSLLQSLFQRSWQTIPQDNTTFSMTKWMFIPTCTFTGSMSSLFYSILKLKMLLQKLVELFKY